MTLVIYAYMSHSVFSANSVDTCKQ